MPYFHILYQAEELSPEKRYEVAMVLFVGKVQSEDSDPSTTQATQAPDTVKQHLTFWSTLAFYSEDSLKRFHTCNSLVKITVHINVYVM